MTDKQETWWEKILIGVSIGVITALVIYFLRLNESTEPLPVKEIRDTLIVYQPEEKNTEKTTEIQEEKSRELKEKIKKEKEKPERIISQEEEKRPIKKVNIIDESSGKRDYKFENYFKAIANDLGYSHLTIEGVKSIEVTPNKSIPDQLRVAIEINVSVNDKPLILSTLYGRGNTEKEAVSHALNMNKEIIIKKIKSIK